MLTSGDVVDLELGLPEGREAGFLRPGVIVTAQATLDASPSVVHVVPLTTALRPFGSEVRIDPDPTNGLEQVSAAQCQHVRAVSASRISTVRGNVGSSVLAEIREVIALLLDLPS